VNVRKLAVGGNIWHCQLERERGGREEREGGVMRERGGEREGKERERKWDYKNFIDSNLD